MRAEYKWALVATVSIWVPVGLIVAFAPDLINIADDEHVPLTQILAVIGGSVATVYVWHSLVWLTRRASHRAAAWAAPATAVVTAALWAIIAGISISAPLVLTGTDATRFPLAAFLAVIIGTVVTCVTTRLMPRLARQM